MRTCPKTYPSSSVFADIERKLGVSLAVFRRFLRFYRAILRYLFTHLFRNERKINRRNILRRIARIIAPCVRTWSSPICRRRSRTWRCSSRRPGRRPQRSDPPLTFTRRRLIVGMANDASWSVFLSDRINYMALIMYRMWSVVWVQCTLYTLHSNIQIGYRKVANIFITPKIFVNT